jgi:hypothetical protein
LGFFTLLLFFFSDLFGSIAVCAKPCLLEKDFILNLGGTLATECHFILFLGRLSILPSVILEGITKRNEHGLIHFGFLVGVWDTIAPRKLGATRKY